ncbi:MAG: radical SAM protein [Nitrospinota bacterium]|nr:radical SAM protein [Nitrospinota bacterium]
MKIVLVYPNLTRLERVTLGIGCISSYLKTRGHECELVDYTWGGDIEDTVEKVRQTGAKVVGFSVKSGEVNFCVAVARRLKEEFNSTILFGGVHPSVAPEDTIAIDAVDIICKGEGEEATAELLDNMEEGVVDTSIANLWFKEDGRIIKNDIRFLAQNLDDFPFPDRDLFDTQLYIDRSGTVDIISGRGCPYQCSYCVEPTYQKIFKGKGKFVRYRSVDNVLKEVADLQRRFEFSRINFVDDVFTIDIRWLREFSAQYKKHFKIPYTCNARIEALREESFQLLKDSGCFSLEMGIESGSERVREQVLERKMTNQKIIDAFDLARKYGLRTMSFNIIGIPFETKQDIQETIKLNRRLDPSSVQVSMFQPYPGTGLHKICKEKGWLTSRSIPVSYFLDTPVSYPHMSTKEIIRIRRWFRFNVLRKTRLLKSLLVLFYDLNYERFLKFWDYIPGSIKRLALSYFKG